MKVAVTGGSGRLGRSLVEYLDAAGYTVVSISSTSRENDSPRQYAADLTDNTQTHDVLKRIKPDAVIHLAAIATPFSRPEHEILAANSAMTFNVLEAATATGAKQILVSSSPTIMGYNNPLGWKPEYLPLDESHPVKPWHAYALSKQVMEATVEAFVRSHGDQVTYGLFRPCYVISPEEWAGAPTQQGHTVVERLLNPSLAAVSLFNYIDARDCGSFAQAWLEKSEQIPNGSNFFVAATDPLAVEPLPDLVATYLPEVQDHIASVNEGHGLFDISKAQKLLGWSPQYLWRNALAPDGVEQVLAEYVASDKPHRNGTTQ